MPSHEKEVTSRLEAVAAAGGGVDAAAGARAHGDMRNRIRAPRDIAMWRPRARAMRHSVYWKLHIANAHASVGNSVARVPKYARSLRVIDTALVACCGFDLRHKYILYLYLYFD